MRTLAWSLARVWTTCIVLVTGLLGLADAARAQPDPDELPGRVGRIAQIEGRAWRYDDEQNRWSEAWRNHAVSQGDRVSTEAGSNAQLGIGSTELRLAADTEIGFERLDDARIVIRLERGSLALRVRSRDLVREIEVLAGRAWVRPLGTGHYRIDRDRGTTTVTAWRGSARVETRDQRMSVDAGRSVELALDGQDSTVVTWGGVAHDAFSDWVARDEQREDRLAGQGHVSPEMTGADELDRYGRWERHPEVGFVWLPLSVAVDWAPFRHGRWTWHVRWGWTWVDDAPWGFATSHYGRWLQWRGRWVWAPGVYVPRPVYAPALVAWIGASGPGGGVSIGIGTGATVGWYPLAPWDVYVPPFRHPRRYYDRVNQPHLRPGLPPPPPTGPIRYGHDGLPQAVTIVPADVLRQRQPVAPAVVAPPPGPRPPGRHVAPPPPRAVPPVIPVPGGAVPAPRPGDRHPAPGDRHSSPGERHPEGPRAVPVPGGAVPVAPIGPGFTAPQVPRPAPPAHPVTPVQPATPVVPAPQIRPPVPAPPLALPTPPGGDSRVSPPAPPSPREPHDAPRMRHTPTPPPAATAPAAAPVPRAQPAPDSGRGRSPSERADSKPDRPERTEKPERPERRDNVRERAERQ